MTQSELRVAWRRGDTVALAALRPVLCAAAAAGERLRLDEWGIAEGHMVALPAIFSHPGAVSHGWDLVQSVACALNDPTTELTLDEYKELLACSAKDQPWQRASGPTKGKVQS